MFAWRAPIAFPERVAGYVPSVAAPRRTTWLWGSSKGYHLGIAWSERITVDPHILAGKPVIRGARLSVEFVLSLLAVGQPEEELLRNYPGITREDILACLSYASYLAHEYRAYPIPA